MKDIAIIGMAGRFPEAPDLQRLYSNLKAGKDSLREISAERIKTTTLPPGKTYKVCGYLEDIDKFDYEVFGLAPGEAQTMGPLLRFLLEVVYETLENAGYGIENLGSTATSVYVNEIPSEYYRHAEEFSPTLITGNSPEYLAARIARQFNLTGSALGVNASCASTLVGLYQACAELSQRDCAYALVCGANIDLFPFADFPEGLGLDSPDGKSRAFSAHANGMSYGEVAAAVLLKPLEQALLDGDIIHAVIKAVAVNNNARRSASPTAPDSVMQAEVLRSAWEKAGIDPAKIGFIEAHGSGTQLGDSLEVAGLNLALRHYLGSGKKRVIPISCIKSNIGHGRSASGISGLIKAVLALKHKTLFPAIYCEKLSPVIDFENSIVYVNRELREWKSEPGSPRYAGVTAVGASGVNCHVVLAEAPAAKLPEKPLPNAVTNPWRVIPVSANTPRGLNENLEALQRHLSRDDTRGTASDSDAGGDIHINDIAYTLARGRTHYYHRFAAIVPDTRGLREELARAAALPEPGRHHRPAALKKLIFIFSDHREIPGELVDHLLTLYPVFNTYFNQCRDQIDQPENPHFLNFAFQYSFFKLLASLGIGTPHLLGLGIGEIITAVIFEEMTLARGLEQALAYKKREIEGLPQRVEKLLARETAQEPAAFIEMGPNGTLTGHLLEKEPENDDFYLFIPHSPSQQLPWGPLPQLLKFLYLARFPLDWESFFRCHPGGRIELPAYRFAKTRCWLREEPRKEAPLSAVPAGVSLAPLKEEAPELELNIAHSWQEVLGTGPFSLKDDFFEQGGDSLKASQVIKQINRRFGLRLDFEDLFDFSTLEALAGYVREKLGTGQKLAFFWKEVLKVDRLEPGDNFFHLGGHSLMATQVLVRIKKEFRLELDFEDFFNHPTLASLTRLIDSRFRGGEEELKETHSKPGDIRAVELKEYYPLSPAQKRIYLLQQLEPAGISYNNPYLEGVGKDTDIKRLEEVLHRLIRRHESLRTYFAVSGDEPVQRIKAPGSVEFRVHSFDPAQYTRSEAEKISPAGDPLITARLIEDFVRPFDLSRAPLLRVGVMDCGDAGYKLLLDLHHIVTDGTSMQIFMDELLALYNGENLPALQLRYRDYSEWWNRVYRDEQGKQKQQEAYWQKEFSGEIPVLNLPADFPRPAVQGFEGRTLGFALGKNQTTALKEIAHDEKATLFMVLLTVCYVFLGKISHQDDIVIGTPVAGRCHPDLEPLLGMFVNTLALRNTPSGEKTFAYFLGEVRQNALQAFANQDYPFEELVDRLAVPRELSRNPLFDVMFALHIGSGPTAHQTAPVTGPAPGKPPGSPFTTDHAAFPDNRAKFDLTLTAFDTGPELGFTLQYGTALFTATTAQRFIAMFRRVAASLANAREQRLRDVDILTPEEKNRVLFEFNETGRSYDRGKTLQQLFQVRAAGAPDNIALIGPKPALEPLKSPCRLYLTYRELDRKCAELARTLSEKGVGPGTIAAIMTERSLEMVIGVLGILKTGAAYLPVDPDYPAERVNYILADTKPKILVTADILDLLSGKAEKAAIKNAPATRRQAEAEASPAYVIYTSGSTGKPRGIMVEHASVVNLLFALKEKYPAAENCTWLLKTSFVFDVSVTELFGWFFPKGRLAVLDKGGEADPAAISRVVEACKVTHINFVPSMFRAFVDYLHVLGAKTLAGLCYIFLAGEALPPETVRAFTPHAAGAALENLYGPTEAAVYASGYSLAAWDNRGSVPIGKPLANIKLYILDPYGQPVPVGITGELSIAGAGVARGYINNPELTARRFCRRRQKIYQTGDLADWLEDGNIRYRGRKDSQVKIRGYRIELGEIEHRLRSHRQVKEAVVTIRKEKNGAHCICAYYIPHDSSPLAPPELKEWLARYLPLYMIPTFFVAIDKMPLTVSGKIDRNALPEPHFPGAGVEIKPRDRVEETLLRIWREILPGSGQQQPGLGMDANFFELGGNSLKAIALSARIHRELNTRVPLAQIFKTPTIRGLAKFTRKAAADAYRVVRPAEEREWYPLSPPQKRLYILQQMGLAGTGYNLPLFIELEGEPEQKRLIAAFHRLIERHDSLRTSFALPAAGPVQKVHRAAALEFNLHDYDLTTEPAKEGEGEDQLVSTVLNFVQPFDLARAPLLRAGLIKTAAPGAAARFILMVDSHHIICDGVSQRILLEDFTALYRGEPLPPPALGYKDVSQWKNAMLKEKAVLDQETYWLRRLAGEIPVLHLPTDYPRPALQDFAGSIRCFQLNDADTAALRWLALEAGLTLYMVLIALFKIFLAKITRQEEILIGTPAAGRSQAELEKIIGLFINTLVLRNSPTPDKPVAEFLQEIKTDTLAAFENQDWPFEELVEKVEVDRDTSRNPLFDVMFIFQNYFDRSLSPTPANTPPRDEITSLYQEQHNSSKFDFTLVAVETGDRLTFTWEYCTKLFTAATIERFIVFFKSIASQIAREGIHMTIATLELLSPGEKQTVLEDFNRTHRDYSREKTLQQLFAEQVERTPHHIALSGASLAPAPGQQKAHLTYVQLREQSHRTANLLREKGMTPGMIVGLRIERSLEMMVGILGILTAGAAYLPMDPGYPEERLDFMLRDSSAGFLLTAREMVEGTFSHLSPAPPVPPVLPVLPGNAPGASLAYVIYTSGSSGKPKGVMIEHSSVVNFIEAIGSIIPFTTADAILSLTTVSFDIFGLETLLPLTRGSRVVVGGREEQLDAAAAATSIKKEIIGIFQLTPAMLRLFVNNARAADSLNRLHYLLVGGEAFPGPLLEKVKKLTSGKIFNLYGPSETTIWSTVKEVGGDCALNIGSPIANTQVYILASSGNLQPIGLAGELFIGGAGLARGYLNRPGLTAQRFCLRRRQKIYQTGDLARWLPDGSIEYLGRIDHQVKLQGFRIELSEIEYCLQSHAKIKTAVVTIKGSSSDERGKYLCAYIVPGTEEMNRRDVLVPELREYLLGKVPEYMIPSHYTVLEAIPLTPNGKVNRKALERVPPEPATGTDYVPAGTRIEKLIASIWQEVLEIEKISIYDNFFHLGGNSLGVIRVHQKLQEMLRQELSIVLLYRYLTIHALAGYLARQEEFEERFARETDRGDDIRRGKNRLQQRKKKVGV
jgi:amino acid adenylation domain-containing protein